MKLNHTYLNLFLLALLVNWQFSYCQTEAPSSPAASAITQYANFSVDNYTGIPNISVPIYSLPTRNSSVNIPIGINYHALSTAVPYRLNGNCGRGWSLNPGGVITRKILGKPDEIELYSNGSPLVKDIYSFNIMGMTGSFVVEKEGTELVVHTKENRGYLYKVYITDYNVSTYQIKMFAVVDEKGTIYQFGIPDNRFPLSVFDSYLFVDGSNRVTVPVSYHLTKIIDIKGNILAEYNYVTKSTHEDYHQSGENNYTNFLNKINVPGFGTVDFLHLGLVENFMYTSLTIKDINNTLVKKAELDYTSNYVSGGSIILDAIHLSGGTGSDIETYEFNYKIKPYSMEFSMEEDTWGFNRLMFDGCNGHHTDADDQSTDRVLQKITFPTGGCIVYDFEPNTYSYILDNPLERLRYFDSQEYFLADDFFTWLAIPENIVGVNQYELRNNIHNYSSNLVGSHTFNGSGAFNFSVNNGFFFIKLYGQKYLIPGTSYYENPDFALYAGTASLPDYSFSHTDKYNVDENQLCLGQNVYLNGNYSLKMIAGNISAVGKANVYSLSVLPSSEIKKWWIGGGIRIKSVSYYENAADLSNAARTITYNYNFCDQPNRSSGVLMTEHKKITEYSYNLIGYANVTITDSKTGGRTEYYYNSPIDIDFDINNPDLKIGKEREIKVYDNQDNLLKRTNFTYVQDHIINNGDWGEQVNSDILGWIGISQMKNYYYNPATSQDPESIIETTDNYTYHAHKKLWTHVQSSGVAGETLETKYSYQDAAVDMFLPALQEVYRNGELISKNGWSYHQTSIPTVDGGSTYLASYLLKDTSVAKGNNDLEKISTITTYDDFDHVLEAKKENGLITSFIWGYNNTQIIAKIEGVAYTAINESLITTAQNASNVDPNTNSSAETNLLTALTNLRNSSALANAYVTTYTYKSSLIGISTVTDPRGRKLSYEYDINNRLINVKDQEGNILSETEYHIIP